VRILRRRHGAAFIAAAIATLVLWPGRADALMFETVKLDSGRTVLLVRDCGGQGFKDKDCPEWAESFSTGDADRLRAAMNARIDEVWLISGGGNLDEGVKVGEVLRQFQATVRVPKGYRCVSACTVAFLGGAFRIVDDGATYEVHAASGYLDDANEFRNEDVVKRMAYNVEDELARFAVDERKSARYWAARLVPYFQQSLLPLGQHANSAARFERWRDQSGTVAYTASQTLKDDAERIRREGLPAAQETIMRIERDSMHDAIGELRAIVGDLGPRAGPALDILDAMYSSRITLTAALSHETMLKMGYVTAFIDPPK
jgi:hypothetical protein